VQYRHSESVFSEPRERPVEAQSKAGEGIDDAFLPLTRRWTCEGLSEQGRLGVSKSADSVKLLGRRQGNRHNEPQQFKRELHKASMLDDLCREVAAHLTNVTKLSVRELTVHVQVRNPSAHS
jgi:hypothetical protein